MATNRITGFSGMDVESMVQQLMDAERLRVEKLYKQRTKLEWKQEAYQGAANQLETFQNKYLSFSNPSTNFKSEAMFKAMKFSVAGAGGSGAASGITVSNKNNSGTNVSHKLKVLQTAAKDTWHGAPAIATTIKGDAGSPVNFASFKEGDSYTFTLDGVSKTITLDSADIAAIGGTTAGFKTVMDSKLTSLFGLDPGAVPKIEVVDNGTYVDFKVNAGHTLKISSGVNGDAIANSGPINFTAINGNTVTFDVIDSSMTAHTISFTASASMTSAQLASMINTELASAGIASELKAVDDGAGGITFQSIGGSTVTIQDSAVVPPDVTLSDIGGFAGSINLSSATAVLDKIGHTAKSTTTVTGTTLTDVFGVAPGSTIQFGINGINFSFDSDTTTVAQMMNKINASAAGAKMSYDSTTGIFVMEADEEGFLNQVDMQPGTDDLALAFGFANVVTGQDAQVEINGIVTTRSSNTFELDGGMTVTISDAAVDPTTVYTLGMEKDLDSIADNIKSFVNAYNEILAELQELTSTTRATYGKYTYYEPLSDDEKSAMTEKEIELWEEKAKQGILYRDSILTQITSDMRDQINEPFNLGNGKTISLWDLGISSTSWMDKGILTIDEEKLMAALEERSDDVVKLFTTMSSANSSTQRQKYNAESGLAYRMDVIISDAIKTGSTKGSLIEMAGKKNYTPTATSNIMYKSISTLNDRIDKMEEWLLKKESYYYKMFSAMEAAVTKANSQMSLFTGLG